MITRFLRPNHRIPAAKRRAGAALLHRIENTVEAARLHRFGSTAKALHEYRKRGMPLTTDADAVADQTEVLVRVPEEALMLRSGRGVVPGPRGGRWH
jgi:hypothetical protein